MIGFGLRVAVSGGREAIARLLTIAAAVALGVGLLLTTVAGVNGVAAQNDRYAWLNTNAADHDAGSEADPLWWRLRLDHFDGRTIALVEVAATGPGSPVPPGMSRLPRAGEFWASPALSELLATTDDEQLDDRYPGRQLGVLGEAALPSPDSLIVVIGHDPDVLARQPGATPVTSARATSPSDCDDCVAGFNGAGMNLILSVVAAALVFPLLMFIATATRLTAARREQRFAAMRLAGATSGQVSTIAAVEATVSTATGSVLGFLLFLAARPALAGVPFTGERFFPADLSLTVTQALLVGVGVPAAGAVAAHLALHRVRISPLGVARRARRRAPRAYRLIPLVVGVGELAYFVGRRPETTMGQIQGFISGIVLIMLGLVLAGPWLTMVVARILARWARRPAPLIAARRLADNPQAGFRAVSGLVLAIFVSTVAVGVITTFVNNRASPSHRTGNLFTMGQELPPGTSPPAGLTSIPGVRGVAVVHHPPDDLPGPESERSDHRLLYALASCDGIARTPGFGRCRPGAEVAWVSPALEPVSPDAARFWPTAAIDADALRDLPVMSVVVGTDGSTAAIERARSVLGAAFPHRFSPVTSAEWEADTARVFNGWKQLANVVILVSLVIAGCSLAVGVAGGLNERRRPFSTLRLIGLPLDMLRRVVVLETAAPLLAASVVSVAAGFLAAYLFLKAQMDYSLSPPGPGYYLVVAGGLAVSLGIVACTMPLLRRITGPEAARND